MTLICAITAPLQRHMLALRAQPLDKSNIVCDLFQFGCASTQTRTVQGLVARSALNSVGRTISVVHAANVRLEARCAAVV